MKIYMLSKYLKKAAAVMSSVMIFSFAIQAVSPSFVAKADSVSAQTTASAQEQQEVQAKQLTLNLLASSGKSVANLLDDAYTSKVSFAAGDTLTVSADEPMQGVYLKWASLESSYSVSYNGKEQKITKEDMLHKYIDFGETVTECTITFESAIYLHMEKVNFLIMCRYGKNHVQTLIYLYFRHMQMMRFFSLVEFLQHMQASRG